MKRLMSLILALVLIFAVTTRAFASLKPPAGCIVRDPTPAPFKDIYLR